MSANNLVTSRYIAMLQADGAQIRCSPLKKDRSSWSASTTVTNPGDITPGGKKQYALSVVSTEDSLPHGKTGLEVSIDRFREIGLGRGLAHTPLDVLLCWKMCEVMGLEDNVPDCFVVMLYRSVKLLHRCGYHTQDIITIASYAVVYTVSTLAKHLGTMDWKECSNVFGLQLFLAHSYLMDEHCPLKEWHKHIFSPYCTLPVLSAAAMQLMRSRGFMMRVPSNELQQTYGKLMTAVHTYRWNPSVLNKPLDESDEE